jgi:hypothetical protein
MASQATDSLRLGPSRAWWNIAAHDAWQVWPCILFTVALVGRMARKLPLQPEMIPDSDTYLAQAEFRPPLYGWLLNVWQGLIGGLDYLPFGQLLLLGVALCVFGIELGRLLRNPLVGPIAVLVALLHPIIHDSPRSVMTEAVFLASILLGLAFLCRYCRRGSLVALLLATACFGLATLTRSTGMAFLPLPLLLAVLDPRLQCNSAIQCACGSTATPPEARCLLCCASMSLGRTARPARKCGRSPMVGWSAPSRPARARVTGPIPPRGISKRRPHRARSTG